MKSTSQAMVNSPTPGVNMTVNFLMAKRTAKAPIPGTTAHATPVNGKRIRYMELVRSHGKMEGITEGNGWLMR